MPVYSPLRSVGPPINQIRLNKGPLFHLAWAQYVSSLLIERLWTSTYTPNKLPKREGNSIKWPTKYAEYSDKFGFFFVPLSVSGVRAFFFLTALTAPRFYWHPFPLQHWRPLAQKEERQIRDQWPEAGGASPIGGFHLGKGRTGRYVDALSKKKAPMEKRKRVPSLRAYSSAD